MSTKTWNGAKEECAVAVGAGTDLDRTRVAVDTLLATADAEIKRLVGLLREAHKQAGMVHRSAGSTAWDTKEFEVEVQDCTACGGSGEGSGCLQVLLNVAVKDICGRCRGSGEMEIVAND